MNRQRKPELLAPAGNLEKLKAAVVYGADAVYIGGKELSLRSAADNFDISDIREGVNFAHERGTKVYAALNIFAHNKDFEHLTSYVDELRSVAVDALIVSDLGIFKIVRDEFPAFPIFASVQANITNCFAAKKWEELGAKRVTLARELSLAEIKEIIAGVDIETEVFAHGAVCISYSGRCLLSNYFVQRDANRGNCAHCCRWKYFLMEEARPDEFYPILEDERGTYILSSKDLCLLRALPDLISTGVGSLKIEGRMKSLHYVAVATRIYREAIDSYAKDRDLFQIDPKWEEELRNVSHREYTEGFIIDEDRQETSAGYLKNAEFVGVVKNGEIENGWILVDVRNRILEGEELEAFTPGGKRERIFIRNMQRADDGEQLKAAHANYEVLIPSEPLPEFSVLRRLKR